MIQQLASPAWVKFARKQTAISNDLIHLISNKKEYDWAKYPEFHNWMFKTLVEVTGKQVNKGNPGPHFCFGKHINFRTEVNLVVLLMF